MALATVTDMTTMIPELTSVDSGTIQSFLDDAQMLIVLDGIGIIDPYFKMLHKYRAASMMTEIGTIKDIASESVADVSVSYSQRSLQTKFVNKYDQLYHQLKDSILGVCWKLL